ncbi:mRNA cap methyltransferase [Microsporum canis CBS 113480]|uniref:mRNA cap guanine-N(7) methyltransferase n=1 Tax=Arthroderma otae (strain ATCC MYA-4605 / CBS 113480) TaxID=554155 RepID=C5FCS9_ARTOC|nr:mRNA cap methyltransferase [Microsporum canis CBS 113480]EEQ27613.1 mRNA cap methyltransferase [Microsporum canis CBS 113480]
MEGPIEKANGDSSPPANSEPSQTHSKEGNAPVPSTSQAPEALVDGGRDAQSPNGKKRKLSESEPQQDKPKQQEFQPRSKRRRQEERSQKNRKRGKTPPSAYSRRDAPIPEARRSPSPIRRTPSPDAPARQRKRPGGGARINSANIEALRRRQEERDRQQQAEAEQAAHARGVHDVVRQHYNAVPERGREWRKTESKIKGLRSFNNWVKSSLIQKFSPSETFLARHNDRDLAGSASVAPEEEKPLLIVDLGCGKGGDLGKWQQAPQPVELYVGLDPADISLDQARERYMQMKNQRGRGRRGIPIFHAQFAPKDCFGESLADVPIIQRVGIDESVGPGGSMMSSRWGGGGFDVVVSMFTMHYAFENETKTRQMLQNVAGLLKKGGRFIGVGPNSDVISAKVVEAHKLRKQKEEDAKKRAAEEPEDGEVEDSTDAVEWGNSIYRVRFPGKTPEDGIFRPAFGWKYFYFMEEAVEEIPEYVVPWEAFRAYANPYTSFITIFLHLLIHYYRLTEDYNLELQYRKPFLDIWREEKDDPILGPLSERMGVRSRNDGSMLVNDDELEAASLYHAFCFYKA